MSFRSSVAILALAFGCQATAWAMEADAPLPQQLTLPTLLKLVAERSPRLAVEQVAIESAEAERISAGARPNPTISYGRFSPSGGTSTMFQGSIQQQASVDLPLLIGGQRAARIEAAERELSATRARVGVAGSELAVRAADLFVGLQAAQEKAAMIEAAAEEVQRIESIVSGRLESGSASRYELTRAQVELAGAKARLAEARADVAERSAGLAALLGAPGWHPSASGTPTPAGLSSNRTRWREALTAGNPQLIVARREEQAAHAALERTERERMPVPVLSLGRTWTGDPFGAANFVGLSTEIPLSDAWRGQRAKAAADLRAAERRRAAVEAEVNAELLRLIEALNQRRTALEQFRSNVGERIPALKQMAEDAYRLGRSSLLELLDAARSRLDARLTEVDLRADTVLQEQRLLALAGKLGR